jgi:hypothetical protein
MKLTKYLILATACRRTRWMASIAVLSSLTAIGQTVTNPSFETDTFKVSPGFISDNAAITGWSASADASAGLNPAGGSSQFADNGVIPDGKNVAFIQGGGNTLSTTMTGLTVGKTYKVDLRANATDTQTPNLRISIDSQEVLAVTVYSVGTTNPYTHLACEFTAAATSQTLTLLNDAADGSTLLVDNVSVAPSSGQWLVEAWTGDADSGLDANYVYTHAYSFGSSANAVINGIAFTGVAGANPAVAGKFSTVFLGNIFNADANNIPGGSAALAKDFVYGGTVPAGSFQSITLNGLTPGTAYLTTIYSVGFDGPGPTIRWATFSVGEDRLTVNQDQFDNNNGIRVSYRYTADASGTVTLKIAPVNPSNVSIHVYGFSNREAVSRNVAPVITMQPVGITVAQGLPVTLSVIANGFPTPTYQWRLNGANLPGATAASYAVAQASSQNAGNYTVVVSNSMGSVTSSAAKLVVGMAMNNSSFEADSYLSWPGYSGDNPGDASTPAGPNGPITGWTLGNPNGTGINPISNGSSPFADNGTIPQGTNVAFMQADDLLSQSVSGFVVGGQYYVHYYENSRGSTVVPSLEVRLGTNTLIAAHAVPPVGGSSPYREVYSDVFAATATDLELVFAKSNPLGGDSTALIDNVAVVQVPAGTAPTIIASPGARQVSVGGSAAFSAQAIGSLPLAFQWLKNGGVISGATSATLTLTNVQRADEADYSVVITNASGTVTSSIAHLAVSIPGIYSTGVGNDGTLLAAGEVDPHYTLVASVDPSYPGPDTFVVNEGWPIQSGVWLLNGPDSKWIGPQADQSAAGGNAEGDYTYRTTFDLTGYDVSKIQLVGGWAVDNTGTDILLNGTSTGLTCGGFASLTSLTITNGLVAGKNTLDFKVNNLPATPNPTAIRVELKAIVSASSASVPKLQISSSAKTVSVSWTPVAAGQKLQSAPAVTGPWTDIAGAANPFTTTPGAASLFYRIAQ